MARSAVALVAMMALAGCINDGPTDDGSIAEDGPGPSVEILYERRGEACEEHIAVTFPPLENVQSHLPSGWRAVAASYLVAGDLPSESLPEGAGDLGMVGLLMVQCEGWYRYGAGIIAFPPDDFPIEVSDERVPFDLFRADSNLSIGHALGDRGVESFSAGSRGSGFGVYTREVYGSEGDMVFSFSHAPSQETGNTEYDYVRQLHFMRGTDGWFHIETSPYALPYENSALVDCEVASGGMLEGLYGGTNCLENGGFYEHVAGWDYTETGIWTQD